MGMGFLGHYLLSQHSNLAAFAAAGILIYLVCLCGEWLLHGDGASSDKDRVGDLQESGRTGLADGWGKASFDPPAFERNRKQWMGKETSLAG